MSQRATRKLHGAALSQQHISHGRLPVSLGPPHISTQWPLSFILVAPLWRDNAVPAPPCRYHAGPVAGRPPFFAQVRESLAHPRAHVPVGNHHGRPQRPRIRRRCADPGLGHYGGSRQAFPKSSKQSPAPQSLVSPSPIGTSQKAPLWSACGPERGAWVCVCAGAHQRHTRAAHVSQCSWCSSLSARRALLVKSPLRCST